MTPRLICSRSAKTPTARSRSRGRRSLLLLPDRRERNRREPEVLTRAGGEAPASEKQEGNETEGRRREQSVLEELEKAEATLRRAESTLKDLEKIDRLERRGQLIAKVMKVVKALAALVVLFLLASMDVMPLMLRQLTSLAVALALGGRGYAKGSLSWSGGIAAVFVGWFTFAQSFTFGCTLLFFFYSSSFLTKLKQEEKEKVEKDFKKDGQRDWLQVFANGGLPTLIALILSVFDTTQVQTNFLKGAFVGYYSCCCGDTWSSEIGVLSPRDPILITTLKTVRRGTNGGVSLYGLLASIGGGTCIGLAYFLAASLSKGPFEASPVVISLCCLAGFFGSLIDSLLGATLQYSGVDEKTMKVSNKPGPGIVRISGFSFLSNDAVNFVSAMMMSILTGFAMIHFQ